LRRYAHLQFPGQVGIDAAVVQLERAIAARPGWQPVGHAGAAALGYQSWVHPRAGVELLAVVAGFQPLLVSVGQRSAGRRGRHGALLDALSSVERSVLAVGGRVVPDADLPGLVRQAHERFAWWVGAEHRMESLVPYLTHRCCPDCGDWSRFDARWCRTCLREFTPQDNHDRDGARAAAEQELDELRADGLRPGGGAWRSS
jgi:hypothetical protein